MNLQPSNNSLQITTLHILIFAIQEWEIPTPHNNQLYQQNS